MTAPKLFTIPAGANFAEALARGLKARLPDDTFALSSTTIFLPTRRAARTFGDVSARVLGGAALLPQFRALGETEEDERLFDELDLPPVIAPIRRQLLLATLIAKWDHTRSGGLSFAGAAGLAESLALLMDEIETQNADWGALEKLATPALAKHWNEISQFLLLIKQEWPTLLEKEKRSDPAARRNQALARLCQRLKDNPPPGMVIAAGSTGSVPATAALLKTIANLPNGAVILPGLDRHLDEKSWAGLDDDPGHPQFGLKNLLDEIGADRADVADWHDTAPSPRQQLLSESLRPAPTTDAWRALADRKGGSGMERGLDGLTLAEAADPAEEALVIALALRESLETENARAALVTPDRSLARRVAGELRRWDIAVDDSAGRPLAHMSAGAFLCLVAEAAQYGFAPVPLLALLKHPFATLGGEAAALRAMARRLDRALRGPRPDAGLGGITRHLAKLAASERGTEKDGTLIAWWSGVADALAPLEAGFAKSEIALDALVNIHITVAEHMACGAVTTDCPLWRGPDGEAATRLMSQLLESAHDLLSVYPGDYPAFFHGLAMKAAVRMSQPASRAIAILGPLEARLQHFDLTILGGLNEGTWPSAPPADPWFSRPMRQTLGLEQPERFIGLAAHDFAMLAAGPRVLLTRALKADGAPTIASRWLQRLEQLTKGLALKVAAAPQIGWARGLSDVKAVPPAARPAPTPPLGARPRALSVTEIETWLRDPYAIYARHVLKLRKWKALSEDIGPLERGTALHKALDLFIAKYPVTLPDDAPLQLAAMADEIFEDEGIPKAALAVWRPRFLSAAQWFISYERERRLANPRPWLEVKGTLTVTGSKGGDFVLSGRADRIDVLPGGKAAIIDYKTGAVPSTAQVKRLIAPQLPLEAAMLAAGGFTEIGKQTAEELIYLKLSGGREAGKAVALPDVDDLVTRALTALKTLVARYDDAASTYVSRVAPLHAEPDGDYDHLARVREWSASGEAE